MLTLRAVLPACLAGALLAGCAGGVRTGAEGFTEERLADDRYLLSYQGSSPMEADALWCLWVYRGALLTLRQQFDAMTIVPNDGGDASAIPRYGARARVQMVRLASLPSDALALDAATLVRLLDGFARSGGRALPPGRLDVVKAAAVHGHGPARSAGLATMDDLRGLLPRAEAGGRP